VFDAIEKTVSPQTARHRRVLSRIPAAVHGVPESQGVRADMEQRLKKMERFTSANYDPSESEIQRQSDLNRGEDDYNREESWKWLLAVLIGVTMGFVAFFIDTGIEILTTWKYTAAKKMIERGHGFWRPYFSFIALTLLYAACAGGLVSYLEPLAAGSGIPEVKTYLNGVHIRGLLAVRTFFAKMVGVMFTISSGLIAGKAGPFVHGGAIVGGGIGQMGSAFLSRVFRRRVAAQRRNGGYFRNEAEHRDFVAIGSAAGLSCVFGAPIGGILFMVEEVRQQGRRVT
jgi:chloride channel 7